MSTTNSQPGADNDQLLPAPPELLQAVDQLKAYSLRYEVAMKLVLDKLDYISREYELRYGYALIDISNHELSHPRVLSARCSVNIYH
ncbi:hypothetical protein [Lactiplantibacillus paraplantarum]|uniref:hypothetical protein n=1 Tax=Lactiplantibacillus paraplantarum TaxID=60520 RepID=UPI001CDADDE3|nr:hypothetical protein [Lactiplantibacillus paraplantarum]